MPVPSLIPESAPFSAEQRTWLNGLFAGLLALDSGITALSPEQAAALLPGGLDLAGAVPAAQPEEDDGAPWHDPAMVLPERMKLAEGRPLRRRLMAAMGQQDCGQCGYSCQDYSDAIFLQKEERLNLCVPGGKETTRMLKTLHQELGSPPTQPAPAKSPSPPSLPAAATAAPAAAAACSRENPAEARFLSRARLNKPGSQKETWHIEFDLTGSGVDYAVGDAFGIFAANDPALADAVIAALGAPADFPIGGRTLRETLIDGVSLGPAPDMLFQLFLLHHRRRAPAQGQGTGRRRRPGRRRRHARRAGCDREIFRRAARPGSLHRVARPAAATALFDCVLAEGRSRRAWRCASILSAIRSRTALASAWHRRSSPGASIRATV